jgi:hypothetical protein
MIVIRREQMKAFEQYVLEGYIERCAARIAVDFPERSAALGDQGTVDLVRAGVARAALYRVESEGAVDRFIDLMVAIAPDFESDPRCAFAKHILDDDGLDDTFKMDLIYEKGGFDFGATRH